MQAFDLVFFRKRLERIVAKPAVVHVKADRVHAETVYADFKPHLHGGQKGVLDVLVVQV